MEMGTTNRGVGCWGLIWCIGCWGHGEGKAHEKQKKQKNKWLGTRVEGPSGAMGGSAVLAHLLLAPPPFPGILWPDAGAAYKRFSLKRFPTARIPWNLGFTWASGGI